jgi:hypothetical protein
MDYAVPDDGVMALSRFCRVAPRAIQMLDLSQRFPNLTTAMLLRFCSGWCPPYAWVRVPVLVLPIMPCRAEGRACAVGLELILSDPAASGALFVFVAKLTPWRLQVQILLPACGVDHVMEAASEPHTRWTTGMVPCQRWRMPTAPRSRERLPGC